MSFVDRVELSRLFALRVDHYLDAGMGSCVLRDNRAAKIVADTFCFFHNDRYRLNTWSVMPNHAHVIFQPLGGWTLDQILHSWKSYSAKEINRLLGRRGQLWQEEYFDHLIRDAEELGELGAYVRDNPAKAGLKEWRWVWSKDELR